MGLLSTLFGRNKLKKPKREEFFSVITAEISLSGRMDLHRTNKAGIVFNPVDSSFFENLDEEIRSLLAVSETSTGTQFKVVDDTYGTRWAVLDDRDYEDLVTTIHMISETVVDHGFADRLLAAVFGMEYEGKQAYWIYNYKRGNFYPMVLTGPQTRDNTSEMRLSVVMEEEKMPVERSLENWYALWGDSILGSCQSSGIDVDRISTPILAFPHQGGRDIVSTPARGLRRRTFPPPLAG